MKVTVFKCIALYGGGLIFIERNHENFDKHLERHDNDKNFEYLGTHEVSESFINAIGGFSDGINGDHWTME